MARKPKNTAPVADLLASLDSSNAVAAVSAAPVVSDAATPTTEPTPSDPAAPVQPNAPTDTPRPKPVTDAELSAKHDALADRYVKDNGIKTDTYAKYGELAHDIAVAVRWRTENHGPANYDDTMARIKAHVVNTAEKRGLELPATPRPDDWVKTYHFVRLCTTLQIPNADQTAFRRITNHLFPAAFELNKSAATCTVRPEWAEWLKVNVPKQRGKRAMTEDELKAAIFQHRQELHASEPDKYKAPKPPTDSKATPPTPAPSAGRASANPNKPANADSGNAVAGTVPTPSVPTPSVAAPSVPTPTTSVSIPSGTLTPEAAKALGEALVASNNIRAILALYKAIQPTVKAFKAAQEAALDASKKSA